MKSTFSESLLIFVSPNDRHARWSLVCVFSCIFHAFAFALAYMSFFECFRNRLLSSFQCPFSELCVKLPQHSQAANSSPVGGTQGPCEFRGPENKPLQKPMCHVSWKIMSGCVSTRFFLNPSIHEIGMSCMESSPSTLQDKIRGQSVTVSSLETQFILSRSPIARPLQRDSGLSSAKIRQRC